MFEPQSSVTTTKISLRPELLMQDLTEMWLFNVIDSDTNKIMGRRRFNVKTGFFFVE